ncbi:MAG: PP2C family protein-serine/threonine phosphatase [Acidimicrobiales bacterium]
MGNKQRLGYAYALPASPRFIVYGEQLVPGSQRAAVAGNSAFSDLNYAIYLGRSPVSRNLLATSASQLPINGRMATILVPFGNAYLTLVTAPVGQLGGAFSQWLPWIFGILGLLLTLVAVWITQRMVSRRQSAEGDTQQIQDLYAQLGQLYREQRTIADSLQLALLPQARPEIPGLEIGVRYVPGASGIDIGGDWYSVVEMDARYFAFVIGDVSGRGIKAAAVMAALRFTIRALVLEGNPPAAVLEKCSKQAEAIIGDHYATVLVGLGDLDRHEVTLANAGHLNPLLLIDDSAEFVETDVGRPLGMAGDDDYRAVTVSTPPKSTMIAFTDGLAQPLHAAI